MNEITDSQCQIAHLSAVYHLHPPIRCAESAGRRPAGANHAGRRKNGQRAATDGPTLASGQTFDS